MMRKPGKGRRRPNRRPTTAGELHRQHNIKRSAVKAGLKAKLGREPTEAEVNAELARVISMERQRRVQHLDD